MSRDLHRELFCATALIALVTSSGAFAQAAPAAAHVDYGSTDIVVTAFSPERLGEMNINTLQNAMIDPKAPGCKLLKPVPAVLVGPGTLEVSL